MYNHLMLCRLIGVVIATCVAITALTSCSDTSTQQSLGTPVSLESAMSDPVATTTVDYANATVKPANPTDAVATMAAPVLSTATGSVAPAVGAPTLAFDLGNTGVDSGSLALSSQSGRLSSEQTAVLPAGDSAMHLGAGTEIEVADDADVTTRSGLGHLRIAGFTLLFSVHGGMRPSWTLPNNFHLDLERHRQMYVLNDSYLKLTWHNGFAVPPKDNQVKLTVNLYNGMTKVAGPLTKTAPVTNKVAIFAGHNTVQFNRVTISADFRDSK